MPAKSLEDVFQGHFNQIKKIIELQKFTSQANLVLHKLMVTVSMYQWPETISIKVKSFRQILLHHQSTYLRGPESASI